MTGRTYKESGVDVETDDQLSEYARYISITTFTEAIEVLAGQFLINASFLKEMNEPYIGLEADGVGTKVNYARAFGRPDVVGWDVVAMCVNDLVRGNLTPKAFVDIIAKDKVPPEEVKGILMGVADGCRASGVAMIGGELASMSGLNGYDVAGAALGVVEKDQLIEGKARFGDILIGIPSSGIHSNGYSLVQEVFPADEIQDQAELIKALLAPTRIYVRSILEVNKQFTIDGWAHITGGGIASKLAKIIPDGLTAKVRLGRWPIHSIFGKIKSMGNVTDEEMWRTFNMGLGMIAAVRPGLVNTMLTVNILLGFLESIGERAYRVGEVVNSTDGEKVVFV